MRACDTKGLDNILSYGYDMQDAVGHINLEILRDVEEVVTVSARLQDRIRVTILAAENLLENLKECEAEGPLDPENKVVGLFEKTESLLLSIRDSFRESVNSAKVDPSLIGDNERSIIDEFNKTILLIEESYEVTQEIRWAIMEHDADRAEVTGEFGNIDDLMTHLNSL